MNTPIAQHDAAHRRDFASCGVPKPLVARLAADGIREPFAIQTATLPDSLQGRDILGRGRTGSGKTLAFALPLVTRLAADPRRTRRGAPRGLVLAPTRELANQILATLTPLADAMSLRCAVIVGGVRQGAQVKALQSGVDIIVATPGRLEDLIQQRHCRLEDVLVTVIDEADHMADLGFLPAVTRILEQTPAGGQRLLFSATLDRGVDGLARRFLTDPVHHATDPGEGSVAQMSHHLMTVDASDKAAVVQDLAAGLGRSVLFTRTKHGASKLAKQLNTAGVPAVELHGNLGQSARERNLAAFSGGSVRVLVATDIAARGIHVDDIALVVHVDPPAEHKAYLHRSGRTARAGASGAVVTVVTREQSKGVRALAKQAGITPEVLTVAPGDPKIARLRGERAPAVAPSNRVTAPAAPPKSARSVRNPSGASGQARRRKPANRRHGASPRKAVSSRSSG
jgi:superfamily II DNA/RNA helicase